MFAFKIFSIALTMISYSFAEAQEFKPYKGPGIWINYGKLPQSEPWTPMYESAAEIARDLNSGGGKYTLDYKVKGGSSHQTLVRRVADNYIMGIWSAPNHATYILGEVFEFNVARLLNRSEWATPAVRMTLSGPGRSIAKKANETPSQSRACNREHIVTYMNSNPYYIVGVYKAFATDATPVDLVEIVDRKATNRLDTNHFLVRSLSKDNPQPQNRTVYLNAKSELTFQAEGAIASRNETDLAKQLSFLTLVDALSSQRDRFGIYGSNMQAMFNKSKKSFTISLIDNGGTADTAYAASLKYFVGKAGGPGVTRFEREVFDKVIALDEFIKGQRGEFLGYKSVQEFKEALGYETDPSEAGPIANVGPVCKISHMFLFAPLKQRWDIRWKAFVTALDEVARYMKPFENDPNAFFN